MKTSDSLVVGQIYSRQDLRDLFQIGDASLNNGVFRPKGHDSVWLFITEDKKSDRTQYHDKLSGGELEWDGQTLGRTDKLVIDHAGRNLEILVFYRAKIYEFENAGFRYEGEFRYVSHRGEKPARFLLRRVSDEGAIAVQAVETARTRPGGQGFAVSPEARRSIELYAMRSATEFFETEGLLVRDVSARKPYDLECGPPNDFLYVEVKGTQGDGSTILLTPNEVAFARNHKPQMALFVLHSVNVIHSEDGLKSEGGVVRVIRPWDVDQGVLTPLGFSCSLPSGPN